MKKLLVEQEVVGMYYTVNKKISTSILLIIGLCSYLLPSTNLIYLLLVILTVIVGLLVLDKKSFKSWWLLITLLGCYLILNTILAIPIFLIFSVSILLVYINRRLDYSIMLILILHMSFTQTLETLISQYLLKYNLEPLGPSLIAFILIFMFNYKKVAPAFCIFLLIVLASKLIQYYSPITGMVIISLPILLYAILINILRDRKENLYKEFLIMGLFLSIWFLHPPKNVEKIYVLFPNINNTYESKYFENYSKALKFANINVIETKSFKNIPSDSTILIPWVSDKIENYKKINQFSKEMNWTLILGGEHTNYNNIKFLINEITGYDLLSDDLTTPVDNSDYSGRLKSNSLYHIPLKSIINRGASVQIPSFKSVVLLTADGWWAEPNINEWLWVGDYSWEYGDRRGRLPMAVHASNNNANYIVIGDNSLFVNSHLISNNDVIKCFINLSTLWPIFITDIIISFFILFLLLSKVMINKNFQINIVFILSLYLICYILYPNEKSKEWKNYYIGEDSFDVKNFNKKFAKNPELWDSGYSVKRFKNSKDGVIHLESEKSVLFLEIDNELNIGDVRLSNCKRLGNLDLDDVFIVDGQVCKVEGKNYKILLGNKEAAVIISVKEEDKQSIILLDKGFLSEKAPDKNVRWLINNYNNN